MTRYLIETNVLSELTKSAPEPKVEEFLGRAGDRVYLSVLSIGEMRKGIEGLAPGRRREELATWLAGEILPWFGERILPVSLEIAAHWGVLAAKMKIQGRPRPVIDSLLAATAYQQGLVIVTRNTFDYEGIGVEVLDPWR